MSVDEDAIEIRARDAEAAVIAAIGSAVLPLKNPTGIEEHVERHIKYLKGIKKYHASIMNILTPTRRPDPGRSPRRLRNGRMVRLNQTF